MHAWMDELSRIQRAEQIWRKGQLKAADRGHSDLSRFPGAAPLHSGLNDSPISQTVHAQLPAYLIFFPSASMEKVCSSRINQEAVEVFRLHLLPDPDEKSLTPRARACGLSPALLEF